MPPARRHSDTRPAEQVLEDLLRAWPTAAASRAKAPPKRRPFAAAFLPNASHHAPRLSVFRVQTDPMARVELRPRQDWTDAGPEPSTVVSPSFRAVADAIEARATDLSNVAEADDAEADDVSRLAPTSPRECEPYHFAAQTGALVSAGVLGRPTSSAGSSPAAFGYAELDAEDTGAGSPVETSIDSTDDASSARLPALAAIVDLDTRLGDLGRGYAKGSGPAFPSVVEDDMAPAPRAIFL